MAPGAARLLLWSALLGACASAGVENSDGGAPAPAPSPPAVPSSDAPPSAASPAGVATYTDAQADRGERVFATVCSACHGRTEFSGPIFSLTWMADPVGNLFQHISTAMPQDDPGSLEPEEYAAVVAYMLRLNGRPAGEVELPADVEALAGMRW